MSSHYPWPDQPWTRAVMVATLDGAYAGPDGHSRSISGPADLAVLLQIRSLCDAVIIGAQTFRTERYKPFVAKEGLQDERVAAGLARAPRLVIVSGGLDLPWDERAFAASHDKPIVATVTGHDAHVLAMARTHAEVWEVGSGDVDLVALVARLHADGLTRLVCEGGPRLLRGMVSKGLIDEIALTLSPMYGEQRYDVQSAVARDGFVFTRCVAERRPERPPTPG